MIPGRFELSSPDDKYLRTFGASDFANLVRAHNADPQVFFIDKTKMIETLFYNQESVILFTRPRRFGKSTNISMFHYFLGVPQARPLFEPLAIGQNRQIMETHQGAYPVIGISLKEINGPDFPYFISTLKQVLIDLYGGFKSTLREYLKNPENYEAAAFFAKILDGSTDVANLKFALKNLSKYLSEALNKKVWVLIDEYDAPLHDSYAQKYYPEMIAFMRGFLGGVLKDNSFLAGSIITGILRVAKESLFSGVNNIEVDSIFNQDYAPYFGFTPEEVQLLLAQKGIIPSVTDPIPAEVVQWYNGYKAGDVTLYNPWSILCYLKHRVLKGYWVNTGSDLLLREVLADRSYQFPKKFKQLLLGESLKERVSEYVEMTSLNKDSAALWSLMIATGYLKIVSDALDFKEYQELAIPNLEVHDSLKQIGLSILDSPTLGYGWLSDDLYLLLQEGETDNFFEGIRTILQENASFHDLGGKAENFYHGLLLGIICSIQRSHRVLSNRESGHGRYDLLVIPKSQSSNRRGLLFEIKRVPWVASRSEEDTDRLLQETAQKALEQIEEKDYLSEFRQTDTQEVIAIGIAFSGKMLYGEARVYPLV